MPANVSNAAFLLSYDSSGNCLSGVLLPGYLNYFRAISADLTGNLYTGGFFTDNTLALGSSTLYNNDTLAWGYRKLFAAKYTYATSPNVTDTSALTSLCPGVATVLEGAPGYIYYEWGDSTGGSQKQVTQPGQYTVYCTNVCTGKAALETITVDEQDCGECVTVPLAFTPDGDGHNDLFRGIIKSACLVSRYSLHVYNRWGNLIYTTNDPSTGWDGKYNGIPQDMGVYAYLVQYRTGSSTALHTQKGNVTLIR